MSAKYFEYYTIILRGAVFSWTHCISANSIRLTAGRYSSIALTLYAYAVAFSGSPAGLKLCSCGPGSRPKPFNLRQWHNHVV